MSLDECPTEELLLRVVDADLPPEQLSRVREHAATCSVCSRQLAELRLLLEDIAAPVPAFPSEGLDVSAHVAGVMQRLDDTVGVDAKEARAVPRWPVWGGALLAAAALALWVVPLARSPGAPPDFLARGGSAPLSFSRDVGVQLYANDEPLRALLPGSRVGAEVAFTTGLRNLGEAPAYLLHFAVDSRQVVHWITPEFTDPATDPLAIAVLPSSGERLTPSAVAFGDLAPGLLRVVAVISAEPIRVSQIERLSPGELEGSRLIQRFPFAEIRQVALEVTGPSTP